MLNDTDLKKLNNDLKAITQTSKTYQNNMQIVFERFQDLLEQYNSLKSDYEEEKEGRERYKRQAKAQDRNPFVLVLIDGDGYMFKEDLIRAGAEGGVRAARLLSHSIKALLPPDIPDSCPIMVRIYANVFSLSAALARANLIDKEARSFSKFASSFTHAQDLFDFVDVDTKNEGAKSKIREMFHLFADNHQCKHIFFGGCHDVAYLSILAPYRNGTNHITLLKTANMSAEYETLGLSLKELPSVFMFTPLEDNQSPPILPDKPICTHFFKGICKFGASCTKSHVFSAGLKFKINENPFKLLSKSPNRPLSRNLSIPSRKQSYAKLLPKGSGNTTKRIPVDKDGGRIDTYTPSPSGELFAKYKDLSPRPCNKHHLLGECKEIGCQFDHGYMESELIDVMKYHTKRRQCLDGRGCKSLTCVYGHHCQIDGCMGGSPCKMSRAFHNFDPRVAQWVEPDVSTEDSDVEKFEAIWNGTGGNRTEDQSSQSFSAAETTNKNTSPDLLETEGSASTFSIEW
ncbi:hypothetical protein EYB26_002588 [Talaromyces marneffei]|uniref:uncharacterized protein n=1 Tax=Talaromyces marneffei TaxID=37727 RepID=UPI0012A8A2E9|nr:uncharacterized protein EYB26_002588 [Talaromyces marneffei]QGA14932.1 hypothetical protein EYB26_002588 [Talaromyces marneffei]